VKPDADMTIIKWSKTYFSQNYITVGLIDAVSENKYKAYWDEEARRTKPSSPFNIFIMERTAK
jgi:hypothetical protein